VASPAQARDHSPGYQHIGKLLAEERCVILDGGVATELQRRHPLRGRGAGPNPELWGTWALYQAPEAVLDVHRRYAEIGCDILSTNTWSILSAPEVELRAGPGQPELSHWMDAARLGIGLARRAIADAGREDACAVAFAVAEVPDSEATRGTIDLLGRVFDDEPPDLLLMETMSLIRGDETFELVERLLRFGLPVWLSFRRCRHGVCGVYGQHWGPPEGDTFGRAAHRFEELGVGALLINCLPTGHVSGMLPWLRDFTGLPLGAYPNLGRLSGALWRFDEQVGPEAYAELAREWRDEGAQIVGGCCGVTPEHIEAASAALSGTPLGRRRPSAPLAFAPRAERRPRETPWVDWEGRNLFPLPFPSLAFDPGVFVPTQGSFLVWKHLFRLGLGRGERCLDVGCGCGILAVQLALNGAAHVHAIDIDGRAVANTLSNAYRNGVADLVTAADVDLYEWEPEERYDLVAASLYQMPVDPFEEPTGHRPLDYWGRNLLDHFLEELPKLLTPKGSAYVMQLSIVGQAETARILAANRLHGRVVDFSFFPFGAVSERNIVQIRRVEESSDAHHLRLGDEDVMVAYLLEVQRSEPAETVGQPSAGEEVRPASE
jgi:S-methylmethionine-dependent homocysteine/selenocysteine methylase/SAM-dependent methyltransferase